MLTFFWSEEANDDNKFGEDLGCCPVWEEEAGSMRPPAAALANAGPRPHTLLVSHFVEVRPELAHRYPIFLCSWDVEI